MPAHPAHLIINEAQGSAQKRTETHTQHTQHTQHSHPILRYIHATDTFLHVPAPAPHTATKGHRQRSPTDVSAHQKRNGVRHKRKPRRHGRRARHAADRDSVSRQSVETEGQPHRPPAETQSAQPQPTAQSTVHAAQSVPHSHGHSHIPAAALICAAPCPAISSRPSPAARLHPPLHPSPGYRLCGTRPPAARSAPFSDPRRPAQRPTPTTQHSAQPAENRQRPRRPHSPRERCVIRRLPFRGAGAGGCPCVRVRYRCPPCLISVSLALSGAYVRVCLCQITLPVLCCPALRPSFLIAFRGMSEVGVGMGLLGHGYSSARGI